MFPTTLKLILKVLIHPGLLQGKEEASNKSQIHRSYDLLFFTWVIKKLLSITYIVSFADPTYMIRAVPSIASDNIFCTLLAHSAIHGAMAGYTGFTVGPVNGKHAYIPFHVSLIP